MVRNIVLLLACMTSATIIVEFSLCSHAFASSMEYCHIESKNDGVGATIPRRTTRQPGPRIPQNPALVLAACIFAPAGLMILGLGIILRGKVVASTAQASTTTWVWVLLLTLLAGFLRLYFAPFTPVHDNSHGILEMRNIVYHDSPEKVDKLYGNVHPCLIESILGIIGFKESNVYFIHAAMGTFCIPLIFLLCKLMGISSLGALFSAMLYCISPGQIWIAGTESQSAAYAFFSLAGFGCIIAGIKTRDNVIYTMAFIAILLSAGMQLLTVLAIPAAVLFALYGVTHFKLKADKKMAAVAIMLFFAAMAFAAIHIMSMPHSTFAKGFDRISLNHIFHSLLHVENLLFDITLTPPLLPLCVACGLFFAYAERRSFFFLFVSLGLLLLPASLIVNASRTDMLRYQSSVQWVYFPAAALAVEYLTAMCRSRTMRNFVLVFIFASAMASASFGLVLLKQGDEHIAEYRFMASVAGTIPAYSNIVLPAYETCSGKIITEFPDYIGRHRLVRSRTARHGDYVYTGLDCYRCPEEPGFEKANAAGIMNAHCSHVCQGKSVPVQTLTLNAKRPRMGNQRLFFPLTTNQPDISLSQCR